MLRTILVGLDGTKHGDAAFGLAMRWARRFDALLVGLGCIDEPAVHGPEERLVGEAYFKRLDTALLAEATRSAENSLARCALRCAEAGVAFKPLEDVGTPFVEILKQAQRYDLIVLARRSHFRFGYPDSPEVTLEKVLAESPRPVVAVPDEHGESEGVVVAYDGSLQASHALYALEASGLAQERDVRVVSVAEDHRDAARRADRAVEFLKSHGLAAHAFPVASSRPPAEVLLKTVRETETGLLVMGAYGQPVLREFFLGSTTRTMLQACPVPMMLFH